MTEEQLLRRSVEHLHGPEEVPYGEDELVVVCVVRDGRPYVRSFLEHYSSLGAKHIAFLDNNSADGTVEVLKEHENVTVLRTELSYKATDNTPGKGWTREILFKQYLIDRFGTGGRWCLCVDIDELFDYPYSDAVGLDSLLHYLNSKSYTAVAAQMLDMFPKEPLSGRAGSEDEPLKARHRFYDISNVKRRRMRGRAIRLNNTIGSNDIELFLGGIRDTIFGTSPCLTKFPLVFSDGEVKPMDGSSHWVGNARVADFSGVLYHYKFLDEHFRKQAAQAVREEHRFRNSAEYKRYLEVLESTPSLQVKRETARELRSVNDLLGNHFLVVSEDYVGWVNAEEERRAARRGETSEEARASLESRRRARTKILEMQKLERQLRGRSGDARSQEGSELSATGTDDWLSAKVRPLFVAGCPRSGTTAVADYLNEHEEILVCQERYKNVARNKVTRDSFAFERILDFRPEETHRLPWDLERYGEYHRKLLAKKDPARLKWIGDKGPWYVQSTDVITENNPGARFIILFRSIEEVAESWEARAKDPKDPWRGERGVEVAVETWNLAYQKTREFVESSSVPRVLIVDYHDFFYRNVAVVDQISRFLGLELDESVTRKWRESSLKFESERRCKGALDDEQRSFVQEHADREAEKWILDRIERQWDDPGLYVEEGAEAALASLNEAEAKMWRLRQRVRDLEHEMARERRESRRKVKMIRRELRRKRSRVGPTNGQPGTTVGTLSAVARGLLQRLGRIRRTTG
jgi:hypothetical protein